MPPCEPKGIVAWKSFLRAKAAINRVVHRELREEGLSGSQFAILAMLAEAGADGAKLNDISQRLGVTSGNVTGLIDRLEEAGLLARTAHAEDRRITLAVLTPKGQALFERLYPEHVARVQRLMTTLCGEELKTLAQFLNRIAEKAGELEG